MNEYFVPSRPRRNERHELSRIYAENHLDVAGRRPAWTSVSAEDQSETEAQKQTLAVEASALADASLVGTCQAE